MDNLSSDDLQIFREKSRTFCGSVKIPLDKIRHEELPNNPRQFNENNVTTLLDFFRSEGCLRLDPEHHVPALISRSAVPPDLRPGGEPPRFDPQHPVVCLHGRHRLEAARKFLTGNENRWWVVDLYSRGGRVDLLWKEGWLTKARSQPQGERRPARTRGQLYEALRWRYCPSNSHLHLVWRYREKAEMARQAFEKHAEVPPATGSTPREVHREP